MPLKIVHCADLHIGASFSNLPADLAAKRIAEIRDSFINIINYCKEKSVGALLICGDLFDCPVPSKSDSDFVRNALSSLSPIPAFIIAGNHDYMCPESPYSKENYFSSNVHIFPCFDYSFTIPEENAVIYGKSYGSAVTQPSFSELKFDDSKTNIMCLHGDTVFSSDYNTISRETLSSLNCDYAAFGHIHNGEVFEVGNVKCAYSGTPEGHSFKDDGFTGFIYAEITPDEVRLSPVSLSKRNYRNIEYDISFQTAAETFKSLKELLNNEDLFKITLVGEYTEEINLSLLKEELQKNTFYIEIYDLSSPGYDFDSIENEESLRGEFLRQLRKLAKSEEEFILCGKAGLDALSGRTPCTEVEL